MERTGIKEEMAWIQTLDRDNFNNQYIKLHFPWRDESSREWPEPMKRRPKQKTEEIIETRFSGENFLIFRLVCCEWRRVFKMRKENHEKEEEKKMP